MQKWQIHILRHCCTKRKASLNIFAEYLDITNVFVCFWNISLYMRSNSATDHHNAKYIIQSVLSAEVKGQVQL